ncbi:MAG: aminotransferase class V-fold PLP-dependent enzyme [Chlamydiota bacterium]
MKELRDLLPGIQTRVYLNYARTGPLLEPAAKKIHSLIDESLEPFEFHREAWIGHQEHARKTIAELISAGSEEIAFVNSTSSGLSLIAGAVRWKAGDRILYPADEYPSNRFVWDNLEGVKTEAIEPVPGVSFSKQLENSDFSGVRLVAVSAVSFWDGRRHDIEKIAKVCHENGALLSVDAIQAVGAIPVDVKKWNCDFLASGGQKWIFGPVGTGFVYFRKSLIPQLVVPQVGWGSIKPLPDLLAKKFEFADGAKRFEPGYCNIPAFAGLAASLEALKNLGWKKIHERIAQLTDRAQKELLKFGFDPAAKGPHAGIVAFDHPDAALIHKKLQEMQIYTTRNLSRIRLSLHASVSDDDLAFFFDTLRNFC